MCPRRSGPWWTGRGSSARSTPTATSSFVPNKSYSGPVEPKLSTFDEVPYATDAAEYDALQSPSSQHKINVGYLPAQDAPVKPANDAVGAQPAVRQGLHAGAAGRLGHQLLHDELPVDDGRRPRSSSGSTSARRSQYLMNQAAVIGGPLRGYGAVTVGPVPDDPGDHVPVGPGQDRATRSPTTRPRPRALLTSHGWKVVPNGVTTCAGPAQCGAGDEEGPRAQLQLPLRDRGLLAPSEMTQLQSNAAAIGIKLNLEAQAARPGAATAGGQLRGDQAPVQLGHGERGRRLVVHSRLSAHGRRAVHERCRGQRRAATAARPTTRSSRRP